MTQPSVETAQSGAAADAVRTLQAELSGDYSEIRSAEIQLTEAILSAHAVTVSGRSTLQDIQRQLIEAITNPLTALDTPAGERHFLMFLRSKVAEIQAVVDNGALTDEDHARLTRALGSGYLLTTSPPTAERDASSQSAQTAGMMPAVGSALGALPQAAQGAAAAPAQGASGLAGAANPLAGTASGLLERAGEHGFAEDRAEPRRDPDDDADVDDDDRESRESGDVSEEADTEDRATEPGPPGDREPPEHGPAQTRPARLL